MCHFGSAMIFYGGSDESACKYFVKAPEDNTQWRVCEFVRWIANRMYEYECMIFKIADEIVLEQDDDYKIVPLYCNDANDGKVEETIGLHHFIGEYTINIHSIDNDKESGEANVKWGHTNMAKDRSGRHQLHPELLCVISYESKTRNIDCHGNFELRDFTILRMDYD